MRRTASASTIEDPAIVRRILSHLGIPAEYLEARPVRSPPWPTGRFDFGIEADARILFVGVIGTSLAATDRIVIEHGRVRETEQDLLYKLDITGPVARVVRRYDVGLGDVSANSGAGPNVYTHAGARVDDVVVGSQAP
jgi:hypothetical protein